MKPCLEDLEYKFYTGFFVKSHNFLLELTEIFSRRKRTFFREKCILLRLQLLISDKSLGLLFYLELLLLPEPWKKT